MVRAISGCAPSGSETAIGAGLERELGGPVGQEARGQEQRGDRDVAPALGAEGPHRLAGGRRGRGGEGGGHRQLVVGAPQAGHPGDALVGQRVARCRPRPAPGRRARAPASAAAPRASARRAPRGTRAPGPARRWPGPSAPGAAAWRPRSRRARRRWRGRHASAAAAPPRSRRARRAPGGPRRSGRRAWLSSRNAFSMRRSGRVLRTSSTSAPIVSAERGSRLPWARATRAGAVMGGTSSGRGDADAGLMRGSRTRSWWCRPTGRCGRRRRGRRDGCRASSRWRGSRRARAG